MTASASSTGLTALMPLKAYHPPFLNQAIESMRGQTSSDWALNIIVERADAGTFETMLEQPLKDPRISLVINTGRKLAGAINTGMAAAQSNFVGLLLANDQWAPQSVEVLAAAINANPEVDFFHSSRRYIDEHGASISSIYPCRDGVTLADFRKGTPVKHLLCWRRSLGVQCGLDESLNSVGPDDFDFPWSMAEQGAVFQSVKDCLYLYREHDECFRLTTGLPRSVHRREIRRVLHKHGLPEKEIAAWIANGQESYLKQCKYDSNWQRWLDRLTRQTRPSIRPTYR